MSQLILAEVEDVAVDVVVYQFTIWWIIIPVVLVCLSIGLLLLFLRQSSSQH